MTIPYNLQTAQDLLGPDDGDYVGIQDLIDCKSREFLIDVTDDATDDSDPTGTWDVGLIGRTIRRGMRQVDMYLSNRYTVPLTSFPIPDQVKDWVCCIVIYELASRRDAVDAIITANLERCIAQLEAVRDGSLAVPGLTAKSTFILHNHTRDNTEPRMTETRYDRDGEEIDRDETGNMDLF